MDATDRTEYDAWLDRIAAQSAAKMERVLGFAHTVHPDADAESARAQVAQNTERLEAQQPQRGRAFKLGDECQSRPSVVVTHRSHRHGDGYPESR